MEPALRRAVGDDAKRTANTATVKPAFNNLYATMTEGIQCKNKDNETTEKPAAASGKSANAKLMDSMQHPAKSPTSKTSLAVAAEQNDHDTKNPYATMLENIHPAAAEKKLPCYSKEDL